MKRSRAALPALLVAAGFGALSGASGCGRAESSRMDSETHWLTSCDSDLDCGTGSCECGVCTEACTSSADCSGLGVAGAECVAQSGACGASTASDAAPSPMASACLLPCVNDDDCNGLGSDAVCESQRCERPASSRVDGIGDTSNLGGASGLGASSGRPGVGGSDSTANVRLCDGSDDIRFLWAVGGGAVSSYYGFAASQGHGFLAIDGQCRFWRGNGANVPVTSGSLSAEDAASFASALGYERLSELTPYDDQVQCPDAGSTRIWTPASHASCICGCGEDSDGEGWLPALRAMADPRIDDWFANAQPLTGPLRLGLIGYLEQIAEPGPLEWPLTREPAEDEFYPVLGNLPALDESSGVELTDPGELSQLRAARDTYAARGSNPGYTPIVMALPAQSTVWFHMLLRDELPAPVQAALVRPLF